MIKRIGKNLRKYRIRRGFTQQKLSSLSEISKTYISEIESGKNSNITVRVLCKLCMALDILPQDIIPEEMYKREEEESGIIHSKGSIKNTKDKC